MPSGIFDKNTALRTLILSSNDLTALPTSVFGNLTSLRELNLNNNDLTALPAGVFDKLTGLIHLSLVGNKLTALPAGIFEKLTAVNILELSNNPGSGTFRAVANAGGNQNVQAGAPVTLSGSATGPWGSNVTWSWAQVDASNNDVSPATVTLTGADTATLSFTAPSTSTASVLYFGLTVIGKASSFAYRHIISVAVAAQTSNQEVLDRTSGPSARFENLPGSHDGATPFTVELHFSGEATGIGYEALRDSVVEASGGTVEKARRLTPGSNQAWELTIQPTQYGDIALFLSLRECGVPNAVCIGGQSLANVEVALVPGLPPFTASFAGAPAEHDGDTAFKVKFHLSLAPATLSSYATVRDSLFDVTGGRIVKARRLTPRKNQNWELTVAPGGVADVTLRLKATTSCNALPGVCDAAGRMLAGGLSTTVRGPVTLSVADAQAEEGTGQTIGFAVSLSRAASGAVTVDYATADGTATAGEDYSSTSGTLTFAAGETAKTVSVPVLDDVIDEGQEAFTLRLSNATGARIADAEATGTVSNSDPLQKMWLSRFGRTVADHMESDYRRPQDAPRWASPRPPPWFTS